MAKLRKYEPIEPGKTYGILESISYSRRIKYDNGTVVHMWKCRCTKCGRIRDHRDTKMKRGTASCVCQRGEHLRGINVKHGESHTRLHDIWCGMIERCTYDTQNYRNYHVKGIKVCDEWKVYENFREWALGNGYSDELSIDRIDNSGNYEPSNCRWATAKQQANNRDTNIIFEFQGKRMTLKQWSEEIGVNYGTLLSRKNLGMPIEKILYPKSLRGKWGDSVDEQAEAQAEV